MEELLLIAAGVAALLAARKKGVSGISGVMWEYAIQEAKDAGINFNKSYFEQPSWALSELTRLRKRFGYRQSKSSEAMGRSENQSFYYALQRRVK